MASAKQKWDLSIDIKKKLSACEQTLGSMEKEFLERRTGKKLANKSTKEQKISVQIAFSRLKRELQNQRKLKQTLEKELRDLGRAISAIDLRRKIAHYHYESWSEVEHSGVYAAELIHSLGGDGNVNAVRYNAEVMAFLQNLHALCDSLPYILNIVIRKFPIEAKTIGWNKKTLDEYCEQKLTKDQNLTDQGALEVNAIYDKLVKFSEDKTFRQLQSIVNCAKHKHLIPLFYDGENVVFDKFEGILEANDAPLVVKNFMEHSHNYLLSKLDDLYSAIFREVERMSEST